MKKALLIVFGVGLGLYGLKLAAQAAAMAVEQQGAEEGEAVEEVGAFAFDPSEWSAGLLGSFNEANPVTWAGRALEQNQIEDSMISLNMRAFQAMIFHAEGTAKMVDPFRVCFGYKYTIQSLADHPAVTGEWRGEDISFLGPKYVGKVSTAAGAGQIRKQTWLEAKKALNLPDFTEDSQRKAIAWLIKRRGALAAVEAGEFTRAVSLCRNEWASLPGGDSGQPQRQLADLQRVYVNAGGWLA